MNHIINSFKKYAVFTGRARRAEYWTFTLFHTGLILFLYHANSDELVSTFKILGICLVLELIFLIPSYSVAVRRLHDVNVSGWFVFIPIVTFFLSFKEGDKSENKYGLNPKDDLIDDSFYIKEESELEKKEREVASKKKFQVVLMLFAVHVILSGILFLSYQLKSMNIFYSIGAFIYPLLSFILTVAFCITSIVYIIKRKNILLSIMIILLSIGVQILLIDVFEDIAAIIPMV